MATMLEDVRNLVQIGEWYMPPSRSCLMRLKKSDLVDHIAIAYKNWHIAEEQKANIRNYFKRKEEVELT